MLNEETKVADRGSGEVIKGRWSLFIYIERKRQEVSQESMKQRSKK